MPFNFQRKLPSFATVGPNSTASVMLPNGPTYQAILLRYKRNGVDATEAQMKSDIKKVILRINGVSRFEISGKRLLDILNKYYGIAVQDGLIVIPLTRPWHKTIEGEENLGWGTGNVDTLELSVEIDAGAVSPSLTGEASVLPYKRDLGAIVEIHEANFAAATAGAFEISTLPKGNGDLLALHFDSANVSTAEAFINQVAAIEGDPMVTASLQKWMAERTPQVGYKHLDALIRNRVGDAWPLRGAESFMVRLGMANAGAVAIVMETLNVPLQPNR